jgi:peptide/nickel transport system permease protein
VALDLLRPAADPDRPVTAPSGQGSARRRTARLAGGAARVLSLLAAVAVGSFLLVSASPVDPVRAYVGAEARNLSPEQIAQIEERWGLDEPPLERFVAWAGNVLSGDLGQSQIYGEPVATVLADRFAASLSLMALAWLFSGVLGFGLGVLAGVRRGGVLDRILTWWAYTLAAAPTFWVGLVLLYVFAVSLQVAPVCCAAPLGTLPGEASLLDRLHHLVLPAVTLSVVGISPTLLHTRQATIEVMASDHVAFARAQGERSLGLVTHRVLRNAAGPALMLQFASVGELFGGSVLAEQVFTYPGLGQATTEAALRQDVPLLLGIAMVTAVLVFVGNALGDLAHRWADPRVRQESR